MLNAILREDLDDILFGALQAIYRFERVKVSRFGLTYEQIYLLQFLKKQGPAAMGKAIHAQMGTVSILVNNAGIVKASPFSRLAEEAIQKIIDINLTAQLWTCKVFLPAMIAQKNGHVVNVASAGGILALPNLSAYCASKFGVVGFTDALRQEMKKERTNVGFTVVCPNTVGTGMFEGSKMVAGTRLLDPEEVAAKIVKGIRKNQAMVAVPALPVKILTPLTKVLLPSHLMDRLNQMLGMWGANDAWTGRKGNPSASPSVAKPGSNPLFRRAMQALALFVLLNLLITGIHGMRDEIRMVNHGLFIGMGYMPIGGGSINPGPFVVFGSPAPCADPGN